MRAPLHLTLPQLLSKSNFLCQRLGPDLDTLLAGTVFFGILSGLTIKALWAAKQWFWLGVDKTVVAARG